uniref:transposase n=1 Tax=Pedobacter borealis TaxID=475254 RepID=UPI001FD836B1
KVAILNFHNFRSIIIIDYLNCCKLDKQNKMSRKYKFYNKEGLYFVSFATVYWIDVFVRVQYFNILIESLDYCRKNKGMEVYCWCIMPSHVHLIFSAKNNNPGDVLRDFKVHTSKKLQKEITENIQESRKEWLLWMFKRAGEKNSNITPVFRTGTPSFKS